MVYAANGVAKGIRMNISVSMGIPLATILNGKYSIIMIVRLYAS